MVGQSFKLKSRASTSAPASACIPVILTITFTSFAASTPSNPYRFLEIILDKWQGRESDEEGAYNWYVTDKESLP